MNTASLFHGVNQARDADRLHHHRGTASPPREFELLERVRRFLKRGRGHVRHPTAPRHGCAIFFGDRIEQRLPLCGHGVAEPLKGGDTLIFRGSGPTRKGALYCPPAAAMAARASTSSASLTTTRISHEDFAIGSAARRASTPQKVLAPK
jgi:hypothetical protein